MKKSLIALMLASWLFGSGSVLAAGVPSWLELLLGGESGPSDPVFTNSLGQTFMLLPAGSFTMGSPEDEFGRGGPEWELAHQVALTRPFYLMTTEVTQGQWRALMGANPSAFAGCGDDCPVESVSRAEVETFIALLNSREGTGKYRLPTEAEWEYACRAGTVTAFSSGGITPVSSCQTDPNLEDAGWYCGNSELETHPVGRKKANPWGFFDLHGNVYEWVGDWADVYPSGPVVDPVGPDSSPFGMLLGRGGGFRSGNRNCRSAERAGFAPETKADDLGFRLVRETTGS